MKDVTPENVTSLLDVYEKRNDGAENRIAFESVAWSWMQPLCMALRAAWKSADLDRQSREASQREFARLNRELNEAREAAEDARHKIGVLLHEIAHVAIAHGMMRPDAPPLDGPNAILFLQQMREQEEEARLPLPCDTMRRM